MGFFTPWQTWVKLTFVLGCSIVVVLAYGMGVRYSNKRKLKKHTIRTATEFAERSEITEPVRHSEEVPFGIRAIERGQMVEGVWNSKASTPLQTPSSSKASSPILNARNMLKKHKRESSLSNVSGLDILEPRLVPQIPRDPYVGSEDDSLGDVGARVWNRVAGGMQDLETGMSAGDHLADGPGPTTYPDRSLSETIYDLPRSSAGPQLGLSWTSNADEALMPIHPDDSASQTLHTHQRISGRTEHDSNTRRSTNEGEVQSVSHNRRMMPLSKGLETLELMNAHRRSHAAETGQLIPRVHRRANSGDFDPTKSETGKDTSPARSVSCPMSGFDYHDNSATPTAPTLPPEARSVPIRVLATRLPLPPLRYAGLDNGQDSTRLFIDRESSGSDSAPLVDSRHGTRTNPASLCVGSRIATRNPCPSSWTDKVQEQLEETQMGDQNSAKAPLTDTVLSHYNTTTRKINPGFEVLPAGTLTTPTPVRAWRDATCALADASDEVRMPRKLQKRDGSRSRSRRSSSEHDPRGKENAKED